MKYFQGARIVWFWHCRRE